MKTRKYIFEILNTFYEKHKIEYRYVVVNQRENDNKSLPKRTKFAAHQ